MIKKKPKGRVVLVYDDESDWHKDIGRSLFDTDGLQPGGSKYYKTNLSSEELQLSFERRESKVESSKSAIQSDLRNITERCGELQEKLEQMSRNPFVPYHQLVSVVSDATC